jgi:hypothetical protein
VNHVLALPTCRRRRFAIDMAGSIEFEWLWHTAQRSPLRAPPWNDGLIPNWPWQALHLALLTMERRAA